jgi:CRP-like cAMP-binding protein
MSIPTARAAKSNRLLAALPSAVLERVLPALEMRPMAMRAVVQQPGKKPENAVFPVNGVASMVTVSASGTSVEVATIGSEGMVGLPLFLGGIDTASEIFIQVPGKGFFMSPADFARLLEAEPALGRILLLYTHALITQISQSAACASHHSVVARCARWILQSDDRVSGDEFPLTHEFLGLMLGVRRASVSEAAHDLQSEKLISYRRGVVTILDRVGLRAASCECYGIISREYTRLLKPLRT